jgi:hypothetical protein
MISTGHAAFGELLSVVASTTDWPLRERAQLARNRALLDAFLDARDDIETVCTGGRSFEIRRGRRDQALIAGP